MRNWGTAEGTNYPRSTTPGDSSRDTAKPINGEGGVRTGTEMTVDSAFTTEDGAESGAQSIDQARGCPDPSLAAVWHLLPPPAQQKLLQAFGGD